MFVITVSIDVASVDPTEEHLFMMEECPWTLLQAKPDDPFLLQGYFTTRDSALEGWHALHQDLAFLPKEYTLEEIPDHIWQNAYKNYLKPWNTGCLYWIPAWQATDSKAPDNAVRVIVDAGMAFGSGCHETTRLCATRLVECYEETLKNRCLDKVRVIDAGCGSGILAISAKLLGFKHVEGFDNDVDSIVVSIENLEINHLTKDAIHFQVADLNQGLENKQAEILMANILAPILISHADVLLNVLANEGSLILSGILATEREEVKNVFYTKAQILWPNQFIMASHDMGEWVDVVIKRIV